MAKNDNSMAIRLYESMKKHFGEAAAEKLADEINLSKSADYAKKFKWAENVCEYLERNFEKESIRAMREDCACTPPAKVAEAGHKLYVESASLDEFVEKFKAISKDDFSMWAEDGALMFSYPRCYCSCVKRGGAAISETWCMCTVGYTKKMFGQILGKECGVELLESVMTGGSRCLMRVTF